MEQGDAISRSAVLDAMPKDTELLRHQVVDVICNIPAIDVVPAEQGKWISVKDRLPEDGEAVLTCKNGLVEVQVYEKKRNGWINGDWFWSMATVTHWMPLPEPPKEGRDEQHPDGL